MIVFDNMIPDKISNEKTQSNSDRTFYQRKEAKRLFRFYFTTTP